MKKRDQETKELIKNLERNDFYAECPCGCGNTFLLRKADLFFLDDFSPQANEGYMRRQEEAKARRIEIKQLRANMASRIEKGFRPVQEGKICEKIAHVCSVFLIITRIAGHYSIPLTISYLKG